ncbi:hypothetical protein [Brevibacillus massiliensis]|uniref:hypothetical protein n=1 Tax=Brevibacillus massiliensis TaxID=1118054 RepID=UPI0002DA0DEA|nr:hypothetical protein [Brevibacillus massiliensis]
METFGRGCLYIIIGVIALFFLAILFEGTITIPWFFAIPLVILAFWAASQKSKKNKRDE